MANKYKIYCAGNFITTKDEFQISNSFDNSIIGISYYASENELELSIYKAQEAQPILKKMPSYIKTRILNEIATGLQTEKKELANILASEACKPLKYALAEVERSIQTFKIAAEEAGRIEGEYIHVDRTQAGEGKEALVKQFPIGLVAGIAPFNFPLNLAVHKIAPAIAAGCPMILKPASSTPLSNLFLTKIIDKTELPKGAISILPMNRKVGNLLVTDERFKLLTFTGSPEVGWEMKKHCGKKKIVLELGGNAAAIVTQSANIDLAIKKCLIGAFAYSGQVCIHTQRIYVNKNIFDEFISKFIAETKTLKSGNPLDISTDISSMIDENNAIRVENWISEAITDGAKLLYGGKRNGTFVEPTILTKTTKAMKVNSEEVFGPVVVIEPYNFFTEAIEMVNDTKFGLQAGVFTNLISEMNEAFSEIDCGGVIINDSPTFRVDQTPYGGVKDSGIGREGVKYAIVDMCEPKILVKNK